MYSSKRQFGNIGEDFVVKDLTARGYEIITRNYLKKWGEIDIVAYRNTNLHFIEVKTVTYVENPRFRAEENMTYDKIRKLQRTIQTFLGENTRQYHDTDWQIDLACVYLTTNQAGESELKKIEWMENVIL